MENVSKITVMSYNYVIEKKKMVWKKRIDFKENVKSLNFKSVEPWHWQAVYVEML